MTRDADWLKPQTEQQGLRRYIETLRQRLWLILACVLLCTGIAVAYVATADKVYEAEADVLVSPLPAATGGSLGLGLLRESSDPLRVVETAAALLESSTAAERTSEELGLGVGPQSVLNDVSAHPVAESNLVTITAEAPTPAAAADLANRFAREAIDYRTELLHDRVDQELPVLQARSDSLPPGPSRDAVTAQIAELEGLRAGPDPTLELVESATPPSSPSSPRRLASVVGGLLAGLVLGVGGAFALQALDPRLRREEQLRDRYRLPVLARIPRERSRHGQPLAWSNLSGGAIEGYRTMKAVLSKPRAPGEPAASVLVTSAGPSEGKTTTAFNLATSMAMAGRKTILIESDLRRPSIAGLIGREIEHGIVSVLIEEVALEESLVSADHGDDKLRILAAEQAGRWSVELLSLPVAQRVIGEAKMLADFVVVDSPPLATVIDALPLAQAVDDIIITAKLGTSRLRTIEELAELLVETGLRPTGFTIIGAPRERQAYYDERGARRLRRQPRGDLVGARPGRAGS